MLYADLRTVQSSQRRVDVPLIQRGIDFIQSDVFGRQLVGIDLHAHRVFLLPLHLHLRHAVDHGDARRDLRLGKLVDGRHRQRRPKPG